MFLLCVVCCILAIFPAGAKPLRGLSSSGFGRQIKENKRTPSPTLVPTFHPSVNPTVDPSTSPTAPPTVYPTVAVPYPTVPVVVPRTLTVDLIPFSLKIKEPLKDEAAFRKLLERYLFYSIRGGISSLESVTLEIAPMSRRSLEDSTSFKYQGTATLSDLTVEEQVVQRAQIAVLEETDYLQDFIVYSDVEAVILQVQAGDRKAISILDPKETNEGGSKGGSNGGTIGGASAALLVAVVAFAMFVRHRRNKALAQPPYAFEEDSTFSVDDAMDIAKSRTADTEPDLASPPKSIYSGRALTANCTIHENLAGDGMEIVPAGLSHVERLVELITSPMNSYRGMQAGVTMTRSRSTSSSVSSRASLDPPSISRSCTEPYLSRLRQPETTLDSNSAFEIIDSTKSVIAPSIIASSSASSFTEDSNDNQYITFFDNKEDRNSTQSPSSHHPSHSAQTVPRRNQQQIVRARSEEFERHYDPQRKWLHQPSIKTAHSEDLMSSDSSASTLENVLNPVRNSTTANNNAIEVFVDSSTDGSDSEDEMNPRYQDDKSWIREAPGMSRGYLSDAQSFASEPSDQRCDPTFSKGILSTLEYLPRDDDYSNDHDLLPIVSPTSSTSPGEASCIGKDAPSDERYGIVQSSQSFDYSQDESIYSDDDLFDDHPPILKKMTSLENASLSSREGYSACSSMVSVDSASHFDPVFMAELQKERRRVKHATRKLQAERIQPPFGMEL
jgi:hypothetical protein